MNSSEQPESVHRSANRVDYVRPVGTSGRMRAGMVNSGVGSVPRTLRIAVPIHSFEPGGVEKVGLSLASSWDRAGHLVTVVLGRDEGEGRARAPRLNYWWRPCAVPTGWFESIWLISTLYSYLRQNDVDVLFLPGNTYAIVGVVMRMLLGNACPPIMIKMSNDLTRRDMSTAMRALYGLWLKLQGAMFDRFVAMAIPMRGEIRDTTGAPPERVNVVSDPALTRERFEWLAVLPVKPIAPWRTHYIGVGRLVPQKNFAMLVRAFALQASPGDRLTIAGEGPERAKLERLARELGVADRVFLPGHLGSTDDLLQEADVFVLSSDYEGLPAVLIEAMAAGLPIVATDCSTAISDLLDFGRQGILVEVGDDTGLCEAMRGIRRFEFDPERSRETAARFTLDNAALYLDVLSELAEMPRPKLAEALAEYPYIGVTGG
jgi:glycosyltransferase involved in cell wall biosynthesis